MEVHQPLDRGAAVKTCMGIGLIDLEHPEWQRNPKVALRCVGITRTEGHEAKVISEMRPVAPNAQIVLCAGWMTYRFPPAFDPSAAAPAFAASGGTTTSSSQTADFTSGLGLASQPWMMRCQGVTVEIDDLDEQDLEQIHKDVDDTQQPAAAQQQQQQTSTTTYAADSTTNNNGSSNTNSHVLGTTQTSDTTKVQEANRMLDLDAAIEDSEKVGKDKTPWQIWSSDLKSKYDERGPWQSAQDVTCSVKDRAVSISQVAWNTTISTLSPSFVKDTYTRCKDITKRSKRIAARAKTYIDRTIGDPEPPKPEDSV